MPLPAVLSYAAAYISAILMAGVLLRDRRSFAHRSFAAGMLLLAVEELFRGFSYGSFLPLPDDIIYWQKRVIAVSALVPAVWLAFSIAYSRADGDARLRRWRWALGAMAVAPPIFIWVFRKTLFLGSIDLGVARGSIYLGWPGRILEVFFLAASILILVNLEQTVRASTGRLRWQIKFMALGVGGLFALRIYLSSQALLYSRIDLGLGMLGAIALLAANLLFALSLARGSALNANVYVSTAAIQNSLTILLCGLYLLALGGLALVARWFWPDRSVPVEALLVFAGLIVLGLSLLSNRVRQKLRLFVTRHFRRPNYDYRKIWNELTQRTASVVDANHLSAAVSSMVSESLETLSVSVWVIDESQRRLSLAASTAIPASDARKIEQAGKSAPEFIGMLQRETSCVDLEDLSETSSGHLWPKEIMAAGRSFFRDSKIRYAIGLRTAGEMVGVMTLNDDRVGRQPLSGEDTLLVETFAAQLAAGLLNLRLSAHLRKAKELEAFQAVSTFFVHDLKNLASRLSLTMQNLPANFDNPEFRADALRVMATSLGKIDDMCARLALLRQGIELNVNPCDLGKWMSTTLDEFKGALKADLRRDLKPVPRAVMDSEQIHKVLTNLVMNANEAVNGSGIIQVFTIEEGSAVGFAVRDNGCGMSEEFIEKSLFRPFQTTKKKGLGIGLFHSKLIVEAHRGTLEVTSAPGAHRVPRASTARLSLDKPKILIVDDDDELRTQMKWALNAQYDVLLAEDRPSAMALVTKEKPAVVTLDLGLPPSPGDTREGFLALAEMIQLDPLLKVLVVTGQNEKQNGVEAIGQGAYDFFAKPVNLDELRIVVDRAIRIQDLERARRELPPTGGFESFDGMIAKSDSMQGVFTAIEKVSSTDVSVLIIGESGTGKELVARAIHRRSARQARPFIAINCGAIPENLLESELFGHEKGSFTGAHQQRQGRIELAQGGTLFLDEIGDLPGGLQVKLLRFLQDHTVERVGGRSSIHVDARVLAATNVDLAKAMSAGRFREDLYYRLGVVLISIPPLRDREGDLPVLANAFLERYAASLKKDLVFTPTCMKAIAFHAWPGNVRELENRIQRAAIMGENGRITPKDLGLTAVHAERQGGGLGRAREAVERQMVESAIARNKGNLTRAAAELEISRPTLYELIEKLRIQRK